MKITSNKYSDETVSGIRLKKAIESSLKVLGSGGLHIVFHDLESHAILLESDKLCSLKDVCKLLNDLFGGEIAGLMMERLYNELH